MAPYPGDPPVRSVLALFLVAGLVLAPSAALAAENPNLRRPSDMLLLVAAEGGMVDLMRGRIDGGVNPDSCDRTGRTALMLAAQHGHLEAVELLLRRGADPERVDLRGRTAAVWAMRRSHITVMHQILAYMVGTPAYERQIRVTLNAVDEAYDPTTAARLREMYVGAASASARSKLINDADRWPRSLVSGYDAGGNVRLPSFMSNTGSQTAPVGTPTTRLNPAAQPTNAYTDTPTYQPEN